MSAVEGEQVIRRRSVGKLLWVQLLLTLAAASVMAAVRDVGAPAGLAAGFGGAMAVTNTLLLAWRTRPTRAVHGSGSGQTLGLLLGMAERFLFTLAAFALGMGVLRLDPPALLVGFVAAQFAYFSVGVQHAGAAVPSPTNSNDGV